MARVVACLPLKRKARSSNPSTEREREREGGRKGERERERQRETERELYFPRPREDQVWQSVDETVPLAQPLPPLCTGVIFKVHLHKAKN
jgi:hypothetical protein